MVQAIILLERTLAVNGRIRFAIEISTPNKTYRLGRRLSALAKDDGATEALRRITLPHILQLRSAFGETANLGELQHDTVIYLEVIPSEYTLKLSEHPGATVWALSTALGRSVLAFSSPALVESLLRRRDLSALTPFTIADPCKAEVRTRKDPVARLRHRV